MRTGPSRTSIPSKTKLATSSSTKKVTGNTQMSNIILTWAEAFAAALGPSLFALALVWLRQHQINTTVIEAVGRAAGEAYKQMIQSGTVATSPASLAAAVAEGRAYLLARIPDTLKAAGLTPDA